MAVSLKINGIDRTSLVNWRSLEKTEVLTKEPDILKFDILNYDSKPFQPALSDTVELFDGITKIFGGVVIESREDIKGKLRFFRVDCKDFTHILDRKLVSQTFTGLSANSIINTIITNFTEASDGITTTNVNAPDTIQKIVFNYVAVSQALQKIAETLGDYDWYIDYNKDIHFFKEATISAPFNLTDTSGNFLWNTLDVQRNTHQLRNHIIIRGGDVEGAQVTNTQVADGEQRAFFVGYSLSNFTAKKALAATPTTFVTLAVGADGKDDPTLFDALYNPNRGLLIFRDNNKPASNDRVQTSGIPIFPLIAEKEELVSIAQFGRFQYVIVDKTIKSKSAAQQRATAEIKKYGNPANELHFVTRNTGLRTGQTININSVIRNVNKDFKIQKIITTMDSPDTLRYEVFGLASEDVTMVDVINLLLKKRVSDTIEIGENEVVDRLFSASEIINLAEVFVASKVHNPQTETITLTESPIVQPLNYATEFVYGPYIPTISFNGADKKRVFLLTGSPLA